MLWNAGSVNALQYYVYVKLHTNNVWLFNIEIHSQAIS